MGSAIKAAIDPLVPVWIRFSTSFAQATPQSGYFRCNGRNPHECNDAEFTFAFGPATRVVRQETIRKFRDCGDFSYNPSNYAWRAAQPPSVSWPAFPGLHYIEPSHRVQHVCGVFS